MYSWLLNALVEVIACPMKYRALVIYMAAPPRSENAQQAEPGGEGYGKTGIDRYAQELVWQRSLVQDQGTAYRAKMGWRSSCWHLGG